MEQKKTPLIIKLYKAFVVAFSMYSKIPMPRFNWASSDMEYHLCFFPWIGACIGLVEYVWLILGAYLGLGEVVIALISVVIPVIITGGFHLDGFMDVNDAINSFQPKEKKLEILKDPHIGAFAVIRLAVYLIMALAVSITMLEQNGALMAVQASSLTIKNVSSIVVVLLAFFSSRCLSGISVNIFPKAKKDGMLNTEASSSAGRKVVLALVTQLVICLGLMIVVNPICGIGVILAQGLCFIYYRHISLKEFGGITGDLAGYFVCIAELCSALIVAVILLIKGIL